MSNSLGFNAKVEVLRLSRTFYWTACTTKGAYKPINRNFHGIHDVFRAYGFGSLRAGLEIKYGSSGQGSRSPSLLPNEALILIQGRVKEVIIILVLSTVWLCVRALPSYAVGDSHHVEMTLRPRRHLRRRRSKVCF